MNLHDPALVGIDGDRLHRLKTAIQQDVDKEIYDGAVVIVARHGKIVLHEAIGLTDRETGREAKKDDVFAVMSLTKPLAATLLLSRFERGDLQLTTRIADIIPEFGVLAKGRVTVGQLLGHKGGMGGTPPIPLEVYPNLEATVQAVCALPLQAIPGQTVSYSPVSTHSILAEVVRRLDGGKRSYRQILEDEVIKPLGMNDTSLGSRPELADRRVPIKARGWSEGLMPPAMLEAFDNILDEKAEIPAAGAFSTAIDFCRFAEMLRRGGEIDGTRLLSPLTVELATRNQTGQMSNDAWVFAREFRGWDEFPAYLGLGFYLRGEGMFPQYYGSLASPGTFGHAGVGSMVFWVDPVRDMTFVGMTAGLMEESYSIERWQRLSDIALASIVAPDQ
ncbi:Beta-lactamase class C and other penicillin binding proteins [hydrothermal vent metagenome]|uniref:Beta-lactamase class C and other penicillin binding proteins n=1 Tax=hydrothermal vent metagenome TaxID=652676 RepID=A0A3B0T1T5_9ZZZZ